MDSNERIIEAGKGPIRYYRELWRYRELFYFLVWRDILVRYKQTTIGFGWAIIKPVFTTIVLTILFNKIAKLPSNGVPYPILVLSGVLPWQLLTTIFTQGSDSVVANSSLITKVYFPRMIIPAISLAVGLIDFLISSFVLIVMMIWYGYYPGWQILFLPFFLALALLFSLGGGLWVSTLNVRYRDFKYVVPFLIQVVFFLSPIGFTSSLIPQGWKYLFSLNPLVGIIDGFRWTILNNQSLSWTATAISIALSTILFASGLWKFRKSEQSFADII
jgi:lipopolysaccharide transport system permease protein